MMYNLRRENLIAVINCYSICNIFTHVIIIRAYIYINSASSNSDDMLQSGHFSQSIRSFKNTLNYVTTDYISYSFKAD